MRFKPEADEGIEEHFFPVDFAGGPRLNTRPVDWAGGPERHMTIDRAEAARALAKAIAFAQIGDRRKAAEWARKLVRRGQPEGGNTMIVLEAVDGQNQILGRACYEQGFGRPQGGWECWRASDGTMFYDARSEDDAKTWLEDHCTEAVRIIREVTP